MSNSDGLPKGWVTAAIEQIAHTATGGTPSRSRDDYYGGDIPWLKSGELEDCLIYGTEEKITQLGYDESAAKLFPAGTICIALYGATVGKLGILGIAGTTNQAVCGITLPQDIDRKYLFCYLESIRAELIAQGKGGAQSNISNAIVRQTRIPLAPAVEQRRIVAKIEQLFSDLDAGRAALGRAKAKLKRYRAAVLKAAVEGKLTEAWRTKNRPKESGQQLLDRILRERHRKWEEEQLAAYAKAGKKPPANWKEKYKEPAGPDDASLPTLPEDWCWVTVEQTSHFTRYGSSAKTSEDSSGTPVLRMGNIQVGSLDCTNLKYLPSDHPEFPELLLEPGDLLFNRTNSAELVGKSAVYAGNPAPCSYASYLIAVRFVVGCDSRYVAYFLNSIHGRRWVASVVCQQVGQANVNGTKLQCLAIPLPPKSEQQQIVAEVEQRLSLLEEAESQIDADLKRSTRLRQSILSRAFAGKLVPQDPKDEPASVLLERIKGTMKNDRAAKGKRTIVATARTR
jgi:type I restriction enzyme S subunit